MDRLDDEYYAINLSCKMPNSWRVQLYSDHMQIGDEQGLDIWYDENTFPVDKWVYVSVCVDGTNVRLYKDGIEVCKSGCRLRDSCVVR